MALSTDGTILNPGTGGDTVSDEDLTNQPRLSALVPKLGASNANYKVERTKVAIGDYGQDRGDPSNDGGRAFPVEQPAEARIYEKQLLRASETQLATLISRASERRPDMFFNRCGRDGRV
jgi:hypothetical protein